MFCNCRARWPQKFSSCVPCACAMCVALSLVQGGPRIDRSYGIAFVDNNRRIYFSFMNNGNHPASSFTLMEACYVTCMSVTLITIDALLFQLTFKNTHMITHPSVDSSDYFPFSSAPSQPFMFRPRPCRIHS